MQPLTVLSVAGSDSGGGAGIQADLRTFSAYSLHVTTAVTALTAQNTLGVDRVYPIEPDMVVAQVRSVADDFELSAVKTGMLAQPSTVTRVAELAAQGLLPHLVVDPVLVSSTGHSLMDAGGVTAYRDTLIAHAEVVTPNLHEAAMLCDVDVNDIRKYDDMLNLAHQLLGFGPTWVLVKGGHFAERSFTESRAPDVLVGLGKVFVFDAERVETTNDHGTGCSLSAAICAGLATGQTVPDATRDAKAFVLKALNGAANWKLGRGRGPIDHFGWEQ